MAAEGGQKALGKRALGAAGGGEEAETGAREGLGQSERLEFL